MTTRVVLEIEDALYRRAEAVARISQRPVTEVLVAAIHLDEPVDYSGQSSDSSALDRKMEQEIEAFRQLHADLWQRYPEQYVAVYDQELVDRDPELEALYTRVRQNYPNEFVLIRQVEAEPEPVVYLRSPRFIYGD